MSTFSSYLSRRSTSGDEKSGVPAVVIVSSVRSLEVPKSHSFAQYLRCVHREVAGDRG